MIEQTLKTTNIESTQPPVQIVYAELEAKLEKVLFKRFLSSLGIPNITYLKISVLRKN